MKNLPRVAIVGRMNVGKSTLFNRLTSSNKAIVSSWAGTTRDVHGGIVLWRGQQCEIVDTGGMDVEDDQELEEKVIEAAQKAVLESEMILFIVDGKIGMLPQDRAVAKFLRTAKIPVVLVVNKIDRPKKGDLSKEFRALQFADALSVSAQNGRGTGDLLDSVFRLIQAVDTEEQKDTRTKVAIVGRPNVGKSSLLNAILGEERVIVAEIAHTTRETNDIPYMFKDRPFLLIDTAGIRRQSRVGEKWPDKRLGQIEEESVRAAIQAIQRADVVLLLIEAQKRITAQDKKIAQLANEHGKGLIVVVNKWDLIEEKTASTIEEFTRYFRGALPFLNWVPLTFISAKSGVRVHATLDLVTRVTENYERTLSNEILESVLAVIQKTYRPRVGSTRKYRKKVTRIFDMTQIQARPPRFFLRTSHPKEMPPAIVDIAERELRSRADLEGVRVVIEVGK